jgi:hypothetical protein
MLATAITGLHQQHPDYKVYVTGHSLGAAMATLSAADLSVVSKIPIEGVYTFGSPRVGNLAFSTWFVGNVAKVCGSLASSPPAPPPPAAASKFVTGFQDTQTSSIHKMYTGTGRNGKQCLVRQRQFLVTAWQHVPCTISCSRAEQNRHIRLLCTWSLWQSAQETFRFTHGHDIVPHVPMYGRHLMKFHHLPREYWQVQYRLAEPHPAGVCL